MQPEQAALIEQISVWGYALYEQRILAAIESHSHDSDDYKQRVMFATVMLQTGAWGYAVHIERILSALTFNPFDNDDLQLRLLYASNAIRKE